MVFFLAGDFFFGDFFGVLFLTLGLLERLRAMVEVFARGCLRRFVMARPMAVWRSGSIS